MDRENFGRFIAETRRNAGLTQNDIANQLHVTNSAVSKWERGLCYPDITQMEGLAQVLGLSLTELLSCGVTADEKAVMPQAEENASALVAIAMESKRKQRIRIFGGISAVLGAVLLIILALYYFSYSQHYSDCHRGILWLFGGKRTESCIYGMVR